MYKAKRNTNLSTLKLPHPTYCGTETSVQPRITTHQAKTIVFNQLPQPDPVLCEWVHPWHQWHSWLFQQLHHSGFSKLRAYSCDTSKSSALIRSWQMCLPIGFDIDWSPSFHLSFASFTGPPKTTINICYITWVDSPQQYPDDRYFGRWHATPNSRSLERTGHGNASSIPHPSNNLPSTILETFTQS